MKFVLLTVLLAVGGALAFRTTTSPLGTVPWVLKCSPNSPPPPELSIFDQLVLNILSALPRAMAPPAPQDDIRVIPDPPSFHHPMTASGWAKQSHSSDKKGYHDLELAQKFSLKYSGWSPPTAEGKLAKLKELLEELQEADVLDRVDEYISWPLGLGEGLVDEAGLYDSLNVYMKRGGRGGGGGMGQSGSDFDVVAFEEATRLHRTSQEDVKEPLSDRPLLLSETSKVQTVDDAETFLVEGLRQSFAPLDAGDPTKITRDASPFRKPIKLSALRRVLRKDPSYFKR